MLGGAVGIAPHVTICNGAQLVARSGVMGNIPAGARWGGYPARPRSQWLRELATLSRLVGRRGAGGSKQGRIESPPIGDDSQARETQSAAPSN